MTKKIVSKPAAKSKAVKKAPIKKAVSPKSSKSSKASAHKAGKPIQKTITMYKEVPDYFQKNQKYEKMGLATRLIHAGNEPDSEWGGVSPPINMSTTYAQPAPGEPVVFDYARCGNPTRLCFERNLAAMEKGKYAFACSSGMACHVTIMNMLQRGDHILCVDDVYGGTQRYLRKILTPQAEIELTMTDFNNAAEFKKAIKKNTKVCWLETPTNPTLKVFDIAAIAKALKGTGVLLVVDNTFSTPVNTNPLELGADIVSHSVTKYIGGHSDVIAGGMVMNSRALYDKLFFILKTMGTGLSAFDSWVALRGSKTLEVRVHKANSNAMKIAQMLEKHKNVVKIMYPGLKSHPMHAVHMKQSKGPGGMISFWVKGGIKQSRKFLQSLKIFTLAESLGGVESLAECPVVMTHGSVPPETRKMLGIDDNFIRLSVGIESEADLVEDVKQALDKI